MELRGGGFPCEEIARHTAAEGQKRKGRQLRGRTVPNGTGTAAKASGKIEEKLKD